MNGPSSDRAFRVFLARTLEHTKTTPASVPFRVLLLRIGKKHGLDALHVIVGPDVVGRAPARADADVRGRGAGECGGHRLLHSE